MKSLLRVDSISTLCSWIAKVLRTRAFNKCK